VIGVPDVAAAGACAEQTRADYVAFVDARLRPSSKTWVHDLLEHAQRDGVGVAGGTVLDSRGWIAQAGLVLGGAAIAAYACAGWPEAPHHGAILFAGVRNLAAVSASFMMAGTVTIRDLGGFDATLAPPAAEIDFCLRARAAGLRIVHTPFATLRSTRPGFTLPPVSTEAAGRLRGKWGSTLGEDPYVNPNLLLTDKGLRLRSRD
jgi:GT2 family glycosyltransferase